MSTLTNARRRAGALGGGLLLIVLLLVWLLPGTASEAPPDVVQHHLARKLEKMGRKKARTDYFFQMLRDPATNAIPPNIRTRELAFARTLPRSAGASKAQIWQEIGPDDVGGRTRALAIDRNNPNIILAGAASGGLWRSTNGGQSWQLRTGLDQIHTVTTVVQDPRPGRTNTWYYGTGEFDGSTATSIFSTGTVRGGGIFKSTDNGVTWSVLPATVAGDPTAFDSPFDHIQQLVISPATGTLFATSNGFGLFRSDDGGASFAFVLGGAGDHSYTDVAAASNGLLLAAISQEHVGNPNPVNAPGIYASTDDGLTWQNVTPNSFPQTHQRTVVAFAPSDPNVAYAMSFTGFTTDGGQNFYQVDDDVRVHRFDFDLPNGQVFFTDRSLALPASQGTAGGVFNTQGSYDMVLAVKPNDPNFVVFGGTNLYRTRDGFTSAITLNDWIGGYSPAFPNSFAQYENHHPDQHSIAFDPTNPNRMWSGHDGGLSTTTNVTAGAVTWTSQNNGYNVTQFYHVSISDEADDPRIVGGTQDNGSPFLVQGLSGSLDASTGDGSFSYIGDTFMYTSSQNGHINRIAYRNTPELPGVPFPDFNSANTFGGIQPAGVQGQLFIHPFAVDPLDENVMYYPVGNVLLRNRSLNAIVDPNAAFPGWEQLSNVSAPSSHVITALGTSADPNQAPLLYIGASSGSQPPQIIRFGNATTAFGGATDVSIPQAPAGAFISGLTVNPRDADEVLAVLSNYNIVGLYHSINGGASWTAVEGNLTGNAATPGPSLRSATILPLGQETRYLLATSTGVYSTSTLAGNSTVWTQEAADVLGNVIVSGITSRPSDGLVVAGTHGRGFFGTQFEPSGGSAVLALDVQQLTLSVRPGEVTTARFTLENRGGAPLTFSISATTPSETLPGIQTPDAVLQSHPPKPFVLADHSATPLAAATNDEAHRSDASTAQGDLLFLDDGNDTPDSFLGFGSNDAFTWANEFHLTAPFALEGFTVFMRTEQAQTNTLDLAVLDESGQTLASGSDVFDLSPDGDWFEIFVDPPIEFDAGESFRLVVGTRGGIEFPAGYDADASIPGQSFYLSGNEFVNLDTAPDFEGAAFLLRALGTKQGGSGDPSLTVSPSGGTIAAGGAQAIDVTFDSGGLATGTYQGSLRIMSDGGNATIPVNVTVTTSTATDQAETPTGFRLDQNYPNPFNPTTNIVYELQHTAEVELLVFDVAGRLVARLDHGVRPAGTHTTTWKALDQAGRPAASGVYLYRLDVTTPDGHRRSQSRVMILLR